MNHMNSRTGTTLTSRQVRRIVAAIGAVGMALSVAAHAGTIPVPNGNFSNASNAGAIGGGLLGGSATDVGIGSGLGPWMGSYNSVLGILAPPTLTIDAAAQTATLSGVAGINVAGLITNGGYFSQTLAVPYVANKRYTVSTKINTSGVLDLNQLGTANVGIGLRSGATVLSASTTAAPALVNLLPLGGTLYSLRLIYDTGATVSNNVDVQLFDQPQGLLTANLLSSVAFSGVALNVGAITGPTTQLKVSGLGSQGAEVNTPFGSALIAQVSDESDVPLEGVIVKVTAPPSGASAILTSGSNSGTEVEAVTDSNGLITVSATANAIAGCYVVTASVDGVTSKALFHLRNWSTTQMLQLLEPGVDIPFVLQDSIFCDGFE
jgi:hypothetical protein